MSRRAMTLVVVTVAVGAVLLIGVRGAMRANRSSAGAVAGSDSFVGTMPWGERDLTGVWKNEPLEARNLTSLAELYTSDARARMKQMSAKDDPTLRCVPPAFPRAAMLGHRLQIVQSPGFAFIFTEAYPVFRIIPTSGRPHTSEQYLFPSYLGDSTARWEGDTLVVDVISFNGEGWLAGGEATPTNASTGVWLTSPAMRVVERWRRVDADTLAYQARVEDPQVLTMSWETPTMTFKRQSVDRIDEVLCRPEDGPETYLAHLGS